MDAVDSGGLGSNTGGGKTGKPNTVVGIGSTTVVGVLTISAAPCAAAVVASTARASRLACANLVFASFACDTSRSASSAVLLLLASIASIDGRAVSAAEEGPAGRTPPAEPLPLPSTLLLLLRRLRLLLLPLPLLPVGDSIGDRLASRPRNPPLTPPPP